MVRRGLVVLLVVLVIFTGVPLVMAMGTGCPDCAHAVLHGPDCLPLAFVIAMSALLLLSSSKYRAGRPRAARGLLFTFLLERPPRWA